MRQVELDKKGGHVGSMEGWPVNNSGTSTFVWAGWIWLMDRLSAWALLVISIDVIIMLYEQAIDTTTWEYVNTETGDQDLKPLIVQERVQA